MPKLRSCNFEMGSENRGKTQAFGNPSNPTFEEDSIYFFLVQFSFEPKHRPRQAVFGDPNEKTQIPFCIQTVRFFQSLKDFKGGGEMGHLKAFSTTSKSPTPMLVWFLYCHHVWQGLFLFCSSLSHLYPWFFTKKSPPT